MTDQIENSGPAASEASEPSSTPGQATPVTWPTPTTGVAGSQAIGPGDAGSLNPANIPAPELKGIQHVWARFKQIAHIPPGRTVHVGDVAQIPEDHVHPDLHEVLDEDDPAVPGNAAATPGAVEYIPVQDQLNELYQRVTALETRHAPPPAGSNETSAPPTAYDPGSPPSGSTAE